MAKLQDYLDQVNVFSALKEEPEWMLELRQAALAKVDELPFPKIERVRYERWPLFNINEAALVGEQEFSGVIDPAAAGLGQFHPLMQWIAIQRLFSLMKQRSLNNYRNI